VNDTYVGEGPFPVKVGQLTGNPNLGPEKADTFTAGVVLRPRLGGDVTVSLTADYYNIKIDGAIQNFGPGDQYTACFNGFGGNPTYDPANPFCQGLLRGPAPTAIPLTAAVTFQNQGGIKTSGIDTQLDIGVPLGGGRVNLSAVANYLETFKRSAAPGLPFLEYAGTTGGYFKWKTFTTLSFSTDTFTIGARHRYLDGTRDSSTIANPASPTPGVESYNLFDAFLNFDVNDSYTFRLGVDNLFDKQPPIVGGLIGQTDASNYDILGRRFYAGARFKF
jgi:iron complex outermembrane recepter protein